LHTDIAIVAFQKSGLHIGRDCGMNILTLQEAKMRSLVMCHLV